MFNIIPDDYIGKVSGESLVLLSIIIALNRSKIGCIANDSHFAKRMKKTTRTIQRYLVELKEMDLIQIEKVDRNTNDLPIRLIVPTFDKLPKVTQKLANIEKKEKEYQKKQKNGNWEPDWLEEIMNSFDDGE